MKKWKKPFFLTLLFLDRWYTTRWKTRWKENRTRLTLQKPKFIRGNRFLFVSTPCFWALAWNFHQRNQHLASIWSFNLNDQRILSVGLSSDLCKWAQGRAPEDVGKISKWQRWELTQTCNRMHLFSPYLITRKCRPSKDGRFLDVSE